VVDLSHPVEIKGSNEFDLVIADVPCSGSGTWGRTPEQLYYFEADKIEEYAALQMKILPNLVPHIAPGGYLLYITCSVFRKENEANVNFILRQAIDNAGQPTLRLVSSELLKGYDKKADTMFAALFQRVL
jgi:16S rRNA (cytosine967-C5)-methyltransferase